MGREETSGRDREKTTTKRSEISEIPTNEVTSDIQCCVSPAHVIHNVIISY